MKSVNVDAQGFWITVRRLAAQLSAGRRYAARRPFGAGADLVSTKYILLCVMLTFIAGGPVTNEFT
jgi:hypothetical protein